MSKIPDQNKRFLSIMTPDVVREITDFISDGDVEDAVNVIREAMSANVSRKISGPNGWRYVWAEDWRTRLSAAQTLIEFAKGKAVQRSKLEIDANLPQIEPGALAAEVRQALAGASGILEAYRDEEQARARREERETAVEAEIIDEQTLMEDLPEIEGW